MYRILFAHLWTGIFPGVSSTGFLVRGANTQKTLTQLAKTTPRFLMPKQVVEVENRVVGDKLAPFDAMFKEHRRLAKNIEKAQADIKAARVIVTRVAAAATPKPAKSAPNLEEYRRTQYYEGFSKGNYGQKYFDAALDAKR